MPEQLEVSVDLVDQKVQFVGALRSNPAITVDYRPPIGDGLGYMPLELLLMSLAACSGATVASLLRRMNKDVIGLKVNAMGVRREQHPTSFQEIILEFVLDSKDAGILDIEKAIKLSDETFCPVWAMLKNSVEIRAKYSLNPS
jgi:putative redox protein